MSVSEFLAKQVSPQKELLAAIHKIITDTDKKAAAKIGKMMGKEMIMYTCGGIFKYGLANGKNYMSLHLMPIYSSSPLHYKYSKLLSKAKFQKGCINFKEGADMPLKIVKDLMTDCAKIDLAAIMQQYKDSKKAAGK